MGILYIIKNTLNNKIYIGQTKFTLEKRQKEHLSAYKTFKKGSKHNTSWALYGAFSKYNISNFVFIQYKICDNTLLDKLEIFYIKTFQSLVPTGYNIRTGGANGKHCKESKEKMRLSKLGSKNPNYGKPRSDEFKEILRIKKSGTNHHYYGKKLDASHIEKLSISHKKSGLSEGLPMYMIYIKARPKHYCYEGYAIVNHPKANNKYFTSKEKTMEEKYDMALNYLNQIKV